MVNPRVRYRAWMDRHMANRERGKVHLFRSHRVLVSRFLGLLETEVDRAMVGAGVGAQIRLARLFKRSLYLWGRFLRQ